MSVNIKSVDFVFIVYNVDAVALVSESHIWVHVILITVKVRVLIGCTTWSFSFDASTLFVAWSLNECVMIIVYFGTNETHRVRQLNDIVLKLNELFAFFHGHKGFLVAGTCVSHFWLNFVSVSA